MNSKSNQQFASSHSKNAHGVLQYHANRPRPRVSSNFSSSFIIPYGLGNRMHPSLSSFVAPEIPSSSSFHGSPLESLQLMSENHQRAARQQSHSTTGHRQQRKYLERQKLKMLKPLAANKNQNNIAKLYDITTSEFSAAILPDPGTTSYRLAHDVSFDEGSRYRTTDFPHGLKGNELRNQTDHGLNGLPRQLTSAVAMRNHENGRLDGRIPNRDHSLNNNHLPYKDTVPISLIRMEDRCELPPAASPSSPAMSSAIASASNSFIPPPSASRLTTSSSTSIPSNSITFRLHKEKHNWNYRLGELSINGGGYSNSVPALANSKPEVESSHRMNMTSAVQRNLQTREKAVAVAPRSRISSRYSNKNDANAEPAYSDPCISAPPSFQQRLTDLSLLESETVKYERNRKLRRKKNQDKDS